MDVRAAVTLDPEKSYEIVDGQPEEKAMAGARHGRVVMRLGARLEMHVEQHQLGGVYSPDTTFQIGRNERLPDLAFVSAARMPEGGEPEGIWPIAPDLAIEVISPNDLWERVQSKVQECCVAGVRQVWLVSWQQRTVSIYDSPTHVTILTAEDTLTSAALLPGFSCRVSDIFQWSARS
jgi:Uma2 family endonuclease